MSMLLVAGCGPEGCAPGLTKNHDDNPQTYPESTDNFFEVETQAVVLPPGTPNCTTSAGTKEGALVYTTGGNTSHTWSSANNGLGCIGSVGCLEPGTNSNDEFSGFQVLVSNSPVGTGPGGSCDLSGNTSFANRYGFITDSNIVRISANGKLLVASLGVEFMSPTSGDCSLPVERRAVIGLRSSDDCGLTWSVAHVLPNDNPDRIKFDRQELYVDPWTNLIYLAVTDQVPGVGESRLYVYTAKPSDLSTWSAPGEIPVTADSFLQMTFVPPSKVHSKGRSYAAICTTSLKGGGGKLFPAVLYSDDDGAHYNGVIYAGAADENGQPIPCGSVDGKYLAGTNVSTDASGFVHAQHRGMGLVAAFPAIARISTDDTADLIRVAYPRVRQSKDLGVPIQEYMVMTLRIGSGFVTKIQENILSEAPDSMVEFHFMETDRWDTGKLNEADPRSNATMGFYFRSGTYSGMTAKYTFYEGGGSAGYVPGRGDLSYTVDATTGEKSTVTWEPHVKAPDFYGDYQYGAFYALPGAAPGSLDFHYLPVWPQSDNTIFNPNAVLHFNDLSFGAIDP